VLPKSEVLQHLKMFGSRANKLYYKKNTKLQNFQKSGGSPKHTSFKIEMNYATTTAVDLE